MTAPEPESKRSSTRTLARPDTYQAAAELVELSRTQVFEVLHGTRPTKSEKRRQLIGWAKALAAKGSAAPAVKAALENLAA